MQQELDSSFKKNIDNGGWVLETPHSRPLFKSIFYNSRKNSGQALLQF